MAGDKVTLHCGDCREVLRSLPAESVHCCVTSPPYYGLRDYGVANQIGLESTPDDYVAQLVEVFQEVRRVMRDDGTLWLNLGDSYAASGRGGGGGSIQDGDIGNKVSKSNSRRAAVAGLKPKDLIGIPWMVAFALRTDGWYLRGDHVWGKPNGMPESVQDRPTRGHEYVFMFSKSARYWYDSEAVRTAPKASTVTRLSQDVESQAGSTRANGGEKTNGTMKAVRKSLPETQAKLGELRDKQRGHSRRHAGFNDRWDQMEREQQMADGANLRSVWWIPPAQCAAAHFAVMPERVAEICIRAGCPMGGTVLDPFTGNGTTGAVAYGFGRSFIGCELNPDYLADARKRIGKVVERTALIDGVETMVS